MALHCTECGFVNGEVLACSGFVDTNDYSQNFVPPTLTLVWNNAPLVVSVTSNHEPLLPS